MVQREKTIMTIQTSITSSHTRILIVLKQAKVTSGNAWDTGGYVIRPPRDSSVHGLERDGE